MQASVNMLSDDEQKRFAELSVFATDQTSPEAAVATLWSHTGNLDDLDTEDLLINLAERSLIQLESKTDGEGRVRRRFRLHDLLYDFAARVAGESRVLHQRLLDAYRKKCPDRWPTGPDDGYFLQNLVCHLLATDRLDDAVTLLTDLPWVEAKCRAGLVVELQDDYHQTLAVLPGAQARREEERVRSETLARYSADLVAYARAWSERRDREAKGEAIESVEPCLPQPPATCRRWSEAEIAAECRRIAEHPSRHDALEAFAGFVRSECYPLLQFGQGAGFVLEHAFNSAPDGPVHAAGARLLANCKAPVILRHWPTGAHHTPRPALLRTLEVQGGSATQVSVTFDGNHGVSIVDDNVLQVWDLTSGRCVHVLSGHTKKVTCLVVTPDGQRAVTGSDDGTLRIWDLLSGNCLRAIEGRGPTFSWVDITPRLSASRLRKC